MEGKEVRFGIAQSVLTAVVTSNGATGSYNSMHDSYTPLGGAVPLVNMLLGEIVYGGLGTGLYSIVLIALLGLLLAGLMVGRTPEYLGKKIGPPEAKMLTLYVLAGPLAILPLTAARRRHQGGTGRSHDQYRGARAHRNHFCFRLLAWPTTGRASPG